MNKTHVFGGGGCIVTSNEIKITPLHGIRPMHPALSKKLYNQNILKHCKMSLGRHGWAWTLPISFNRITATTTTIDKYTIVELTHNNKHYHGLASRADCDKENAVTGIAVAYHRAFEKMVDVFKIGVATYDENSPKMQGSSPSTVVLDDAVDLPAKKWKEMWATKKFDSSTYRQSLNRFSEDKNPGIVFHIKSGKKVTK